MSDTFELNTRYYRALPTNDAGHEEQILQLPIARTALVVMHCWNIGCPDGPPEDLNFCVGMGWPQATSEANRIMHEVIRPALDTARAVGLPVCHVESDWMDAHYPDVPSRPVTAQGNATGHAREMSERAHGVEFLARSPLAEMKRAEVVAPVGDEPFVFYSDQLDAHLRERGVEALIYTGFATDMCILDSPGGARAMMSLGYRCILMRDATVGVESPDTFPDRLATRYGIHRFEWQVGNSTLSKDFHAALQSI